MLMLYVLVIQKISSLIWIIFFFRFLEDIWKFLITINYNRFRNNYVAYLQYYGNAKEISVY